MQLVLLLVAAVGGVPVQRAVSKPVASPPPRHVPVAHSYGMVLESRGILEQFLDQVDVGHDHTAAAVALEAKLVHGITAGQISLAQSLRKLSLLCVLPILDILVDQHKVALPQIACNLC